MNKKYRLFGKIPVADILIVLLLLGLTFVSIRFLTKNDVQEQTGSSSQVQQKLPYNAVFCVENTAEENFDLIEVGDKLFLSDGTLVGTVTEKKAQPYISYLTDSATGIQKGTEMKGRVNVFISVSGEATSISARGIKIHNRFVAYNKSITMGNEKYGWSMETVWIDRGTK